MSTKTALKRENITQQPASVIEKSTAEKIANAWMDINAAEEALSRLDTGIVQWRVAPAVQNLAASAITDMLQKTDTVRAVGFQPYAWTRAMGASVANILEVQLGKQLPDDTVTPSTTDDVVAGFVAGKMAIVAIHAETAADWNDVRVISAAAVKAEAPMLMIISTSGEAPKGVTMTVHENWADAVADMRAAAVSVRNQKAIRVVAMADMSSAEIEVAMIEAAGMDAGTWQNRAQKNADGAEVAVNAAYQAPVKSF